MTFELLPEGAVPAIAGAELFVWPQKAGSTTTVASGVGAWLDELGSVSHRAIDLVRIAAGAYMADRRSPRGQGFCRTIELHVQLVDTGPWLEVLDVVAGLLFWLSGDTWSLSVSSDGVAVPTTTAARPDPVGTVALLSGGLDSFCGAVLSRAEGRLFLGHWDSPTIKAAQNAIKSWLDSSLDGDFRYEQLRIVQTQKKLESSARSRSLLFLALAAAVAESCGAPIVEVPENGYTTLNPPLGSERGGALSTRSTHPYTLAEFNRVLEALGLAVRITDPYATLTKGQLVGRALAVGLPDFAGGVASTLSCGKLDGGRYRGGNPNHNCGLCFPCIVRRGAIAAAGVADETIYLANALTGDALRRLYHNRRSDILAVRRAVLDGFSDETLLAMGPFPLGFDLDQAENVCRAGLSELRGVELE
jgi:7-cyano-7-deazaguanine synthase in queuosine biosynthesis